MSANISTNLNGVINFTSRNDVPVWWGGNNSQVYKAEDNLDMIQVTGKSNLGHYELIDANPVREGQYLESHIKHVYRITPENKAIELGTADENYPLIQNLTIAEIFNKVSLTFPVVSHGAIGKGERVFWTLDGGMWEVKSKNGALIPMKTYLCVVDNKVAKEKTFILLTPVCIVCQNTENLARNLANINVGVRHSKGNIDVLEDVAKSVEQIQKQQSIVNELFNTMADTKYSTEDFKNLVCGKLYKNKEIVDLQENGETQEFVDPDLVFASPTEDKQLLVMSLFQKYNDENPKLANTAWGAYNTITEYEDWRKKRGIQNSLSSLFGTGNSPAGIKEKAFVEIVKATK